MREEQFRRDLEEDEQRKRARENEDSNFTGYAQECMKTWSENGKSVYPIIKHLQATRGG